VRRVAAGLLAAFSCARAPVAITRDAAPAEVARAESAISSLRARLVTRLTEALGTAGPAGAIAVCSTEAPAIAARVDTESSVELGRTSFKVRNALNAPRPWAAAYVTAAAGSTAAAAKGAVFDLGDRVGVLTPIPVAAMCVTCHGPRSQLSPEVASALSERYPEDQAVGFAEGDLRGYFWAEVPGQ
jgi:hypothetical protein